MHQIDGLCFLIFAERGLWNRFVPSLDGYIQDRLNNPVHVPKHGTVKAIRLEAPPAGPGPAGGRGPAAAGAWTSCPTASELPDIFPFTDEQVLRIARTEPTLRDMLQQFRHLFDHVVYGPDDGGPTPHRRADASPEPTSSPVYAGGHAGPDATPARQATWSPPPVTIKSVAIVECRRTGEPDRRPPRTDRRPNRRA